MRLGRRAGLGLACALLWWHPVQAQLAWPDGAAVQVRSERFSDPLPLQDLMASRLEGLQPRHARSLIYLRDEARVSAQWGSASLSVLARQSATLMGNRGAATLARDVATAGPPPGGDYDADVSLHMRGFAGYGLAVQWQGEHLASGLQWQVGLQGLQLTRLLTRDISGWAHFDAASASYATRLTSDQFNDRHHYPFQGAADAQGWGWLGQLALSWQPSADWQWRAGVDDLGRLHWHRIAHEQATLDTNVASTDAQGNVVYQPLVQGHNSQDRLMLDATATWHAGASWAWQPDRAIDIEVRRFSGMPVVLPYSGVHLSLDGWDTRLGWLWYEGAAQISLAQGPWLLQLAGDRLDSQAHTRQVALRWQSRW